MRALTNSLVPGNVRAAATRLIGRAPPQDIGPALRSLPSADRAIVEQAAPYTMTGIPRLQALIEGVRYCVRREVPGSFVECGVWRGGSILAIILMLQNLEVADRDVYLYDTFEGMTEPTESDVSRFDGSALKVWRQAERRRVRPFEFFFNAERFNEGAVREMILSTGYPSERIHFVKGRVEDTLPDRAPERLALLRLDTDWYESTRHELHHLYPRLADGGVMIIDDYGHWAGARRAVDEYFENEAPPPLLHWIDYTARIAVKT
ncbi:MAG: hypothetical protein NVS4B3_18620 [Gemmatimonadaceae bacterium]